MSKVTYLSALNKAHLIEQISRRDKARAPYKNKDKDRWLEVCNAHNRKATRKARRSVGKSNKIGIRRTAKGMCGFLIELNMLTQICRTNREWLAKNREVGDAN
ncbi:MAG: ANR family transcriptional regulator [Serratia liquefaciens]|jgi:O-glycosyl hydrolase